MVKSKENKKIWKEARKKGFFIARDMPSLVCQELSYYMDLPGRVLDVGCGEGRNSIFFARMGYEVDALDIANVFSKENKEHGLMKFHNKDFREFDLKDNHYLSIIATRFLHHVSDGMVEDLINKWHKALQPGGNLALSFAFFGEPFKKVGLPFHHHEPSRVIDIAEKVGFTVLIKKDINKVPSGINRARNKLGDSFEVIFKKK